ncbi:MAG: DUF882 domain-containing protein [Pseudomonadota bacterium]
MRTDLHPTTFLAIVLLTLILFIGSAYGYDIPSDLKGDGEITLYRPAINERETFRYRDENGNHSRETMDAIAYFFRCRMTDEEFVIDSKLIELIDAIEDHFNAKEIKLVSAYRSPIRNFSMRMRNRRVAKESYHMKGMAADIEVSNISARQVRDFAYVLNQGGVGYYRKRSFVHVDTGPLRTWGFKPRRYPQRTAPAMSHK